MTVAPVLIAGFHRSGTSAVARSLHSAGLHLGDELLGAEVANPYGHFEDVHVIDAHDDALRRSDLTWKSPVARPEMSDSILRTFIETLAMERESSERPWGIKDPRLCLFLDQWLSVLPTANVIVVYRRPGDAVASLHRRHVRRLVDTRYADRSDRAFWESPDLGLQLWIHYHEQLLRSLPDPSRVLAVNFAHRATIEAIPAVVGSKWEVPLSSTAPTLLDPALGSGSPARLEVRDTTLVDRARQIWHQLSALTPN